MYNSFTSIISHCDSNNNLLIKAFLTMWLFYTKSIHENHVFNIVITLTGGIESFYYGNRETLTSYI